MKKIIYNIFGLRLFTIAALTAVCGTVFAQVGQSVDDDPLYPWYSSDQSAYVLRTIDEDHTVYDALKALQNINTDGSWSDYSAYNFYLAEDVDFDNYVDDGNNKLNWVPLGTSSNPFKSSFYCYAPTWDYYDYPRNSLNVYPKSTTSSPASKVWEDAKKYTYNISDIDIESYGCSDIYEFASSNLSDSYFYEIDETAGTISVYGTEEDYEQNFGSNITQKLTPTVVFTYTINNIDLGDYSEDIEGYIENILTDYTDDTTIDENNGTMSISASLDNYETICSKIKGSNGDELTPTITYTYKIDDIDLGDYSEDIEGYIENILTDYTDDTTIDENNGTISISASLDVYHETLSSIIQGKPITPKISEETVYYRVKPCELGNLGHYYASEDDASNGKYTYYTTDGHIGTCKISNMTVDGSYPDGAGFFGYVSNNNSIEFCGFTFDNCSVTNTSENAYAGTLFGYSDYSVTVQDFFIGVTNACSVSTATDEHAGGVYGGICEGYEVTINSANITDYTFDDDIADEMKYQDENETTFSCNYVHADVTNGSVISSTSDEADNTYVYGNDQEPTSYAFGTDTEGNYGDGSEDNPFIISSSDHIKNMRNLFSGKADVSDYLDLKDNVTSISGKYFKQIADIELGTLSNGIGYYDESSNTDIPFDGTYDAGNDDGGRYKITVNITTSSSYCALFAYTKSATIKNLDIEGTNTQNNGSGYCGGIIAYDNNESSSTTIDNCVVNVGTVKYGLVGGLEKSDENSVTIKNSFNKAAKDMMFTPSSDEETIHYQYGKPSTSLTGEGTKAFPLKISSLSELNDFYANCDEEILNCGLYYRMNNNIFVNEDRLVDINGNATLPEDVTNDDCYITKFCGILYASQATNSLVAGLTNKALIGEIVGDTEIKNMAFVNCYTEDTTNGHKVKLANKIDDGKTLSVDKCYSDTYFDFSSASEITNSYAYNNGDVTYYYADGTSSNEKPEASDIWGSDALSSRMILKGLSVTLYNSDGDKTGMTDAIANIPTNNTIIFTKNYDLLLYKYNIALYLEGKLSNLYLTDIMDYYDTNKENSNITAANIKATDYTNELSGVVANAYYCRKYHNKWESVTLPFDYTLDDIQNSGFSAYVLDEDNSGVTTNSESGTTTRTLTVKFKAFNGSTISAGTPILFYNNGTNDFVVKASNTNCIANKDLSSEGKFIGVLQSTGNGTMSTGKATINTAMVGKFKVAGSGSSNGGTLLYCTSESWVYPFRAYLDFTLEAAAAKRNIEFSIYDEEGSNINKIDVVNGELVEHPTGSVYSIDGRKVSCNGLNGLKPGLYISGGKKFMIK